MGDKTRGLYPKFDFKDADDHMYANGLTSNGKNVVVTRIDGRDKEGQKHCDCSYFVLEKSEDGSITLAVQAAVLAYAGACRKEYPLLAADIDNGKTFNSGPFALDLYHDEYTPYAMAAYNRGGWLSRGCNGCLSNNHP